MEYTIVPMDRSHIGQIAEPGAGVFLCSVE